MFQNQSCGHSSCRRSTPVSPALQRHSVPATAVAGLGGPSKVDVNDVESLTNPRVADTVNGDARSPCHPVGRRRYIVGGDAGGGCRSSSTLIMRSRPRLVVFPALRFVKMTHNASVTRHRLKHLLLLLMRMAAIALLAVILARPKLESMGSLGLGSKPPVSAVIVLDTSGSMAYQVKGQTRLAEALRAGYQAGQGPARRLGGRPAVGRLSRRGGQAGREGGRAGANSRRCSTRPLRAMEAAGLRIAPASG